MRPRVPVLACAFWSGLCGPQELDAGLFPQSTAEGPECIALTWFRLLILQHEEDTSDPFG